MAPMIKKDALAVRIAPHLDRRSGRRGNLMSIDMRPVSSHTQLIAIKGDKDEGLY